VLDLPAWTTVDDSIPLQLALYGLFHVKWMMFAIGGLVAISSITYPAISAFLSKNSSPEQQVRHSFPLLLCPARAHWLLMSRVLFKAW
jgi:hypothetical protein